MNEFTNWQFNCTRVHELEHSLDCMEYAEGMQKLVEVHLWWYHMNRSALLQPVECATHAEHRVLKTWIRQIVIRGFWEQGLSFDDFKIVRINQQTQQNETLSRVLNVRSYKSMCVQDWNTCRYHSMCSRDWWLMHSEVSFLDQRAFKVEARTLQLTLMSLVHSRAKHNIFTYNDLVYSRRNTVA